MENLLRIITCDTKLLKIHCESDEPSRLAFRSSNLNPIEYVWDSMERQDKACIQPHWPGFLRKTKIFLIPSNIESLPRRISRSCLIILSFMAFLM